MHRHFGLLVMAALAAGCGGTAPSAAAPTVVTPATAAPTEAAQPTVAPAPTSAGGGTAGDGYLVCPALDGDVCPVPAGTYRVDIHDAFGLSVPDAGWIELPQPIDEEPTLVLARADAPDQRVIIDSGPTGAILDDAELPHLLDLAVAVGASAPTPVDVGGAVGNQVEISPTEANRFALGEADTVGVAGTVEIEPGKTYRIAALQVPYDQESALKVIVIAAPSGDFEAFAPLADSLLETVKFVE